MDDVFIVSRENVVNEEPEDWRDPGVGDKMAIESNKQLEQDKKELLDAVERMLLKSEDIEDRKLAIDLLIKFKD